MSSDEGLKGETSAPYTTYSDDHKHSNLKLYKLQLLWLRTDSQNVSFFTVYVADYTIFTLKMVILLNLSAA